MKICFYTDTFFPLVGGAEVVLHNLAKELKALGHEPVVLAPRVRHMHNPADLGYPIYRYSQPSSKRFLTRQTLWYLLRLHSSTKFELLHCHAAYPPAYVGASFKRLVRVPMVVRPHGGDVVPNGRIRKHPRLERRLRGALAAADAVIAQGRYLQNVILALGVEPERVHIINNGVALTSFRNRRPFSYPRPYVLGLGNLIHRKGFDLLLRAYAGLPDCEVDLLIAGNGRVRADLERLAHELNIDDRVKFLGFIEGQNKVDLLGSARALVCPSRSEPFANVILEAFAAGIPVIASDVEGNTELIRHRQRGLLFPSEDVQALATALRTVLADEALQSSMRKAISKFIRNFDWPVIARQYLALYEELCDRYGRS